LLGLARRAHVRRSVGRRELDPSFPQSVVRDTAARARRPARAVGRDERRIEIDEDFDIACLRAFRSRSRNAPPTIQASMPSRRADRARASISARRRSPWSFRAACPRRVAICLRYGRASGERIVAMVEEGLTARKIMTREALLNAVIMDLAIGGVASSPVALGGYKLDLSIALPREHALILRYMNVQELCLFDPCVAPGRAMEVAALYGWTPHARFAGATLAAGAGVLASLTSARAEVTSEATTRTR
jgi:hypothetical protein